MEPLTITAITSVVTYLAKKLKDNKSIQGFFDDFTEATVNWIKPIFIREDGTPKDVLENLQKFPDDEDAQISAKANISQAVKQNPSAEKLLQAMAKIIQEKSPEITSKNVINNSGDNNKFIQGNYNTNITDNSVVQSLSGTGDISNNKK